MSYDQKCFNLGLCFLEDEDRRLMSNRNLERIAQRIQDCIEDEILRIKQDADAALEAAKNEAVDRRIDEAQMQRYKGQCLRESSQWQSQFRSGK